MLVGMIMRTSESHYATSDKTYNIQHDHQSLLLGTLNAQRAPWRSLKAACDLSICLSLEAGSSIELSFRSFTMPCMSNIAVTAVPHRQNTWAIKQGRMATVNEQSKSISMACPVVHTQLECAIACQNMQKIVILRDNGGLMVIGC